MGWVVKLSGQERDLDLLSRLFSDDPRVFESEGEYYLDSSELKSCDDIREARGYAEKQLNIIKGVRLFELQSSPDMSIEAIGRLGPDGFRTQSVSVTTTVQAPIPDYVCTMPEFTNVRDYSQLADEDPVVQDLIDLLLRGNSWVNLYRIFEFIQDHPNDGDSITSKGWISDSKKSLFTQTANSRGAIGDEARHAKENPPSPDEPMEAHEATHMIGELSRKWLNERINAVNTE